MNKSKIEERLPEPQLNQGTNDDATSVSPSIAKPLVGCCTSLAETAIQQARSLLNNSIKDLIESNATANFKIINALEEVDMMLCKLFQDEKNIIQDAFDNGQANWDEKCQDYKDGKEYFNNCFKK